MTRLSPQQEQLLSQSQDPANYPNILTTAFSNLERDIQKVWDATYGIRFEYNNRTYPFNGWETAPDGMVVRLLVLAVQGALIKTESGLIIRNEDPLARNEIVLLNKTWVPDEPTKESSSGANTVEMVLNTTNNSNKKVTINLATGIRASGIFVVQEDIVQDIKDIFSGTSYPFFKDKPVLTYVYRKKP